MSPIVAVCKDCGKEFTISVKEQLFAQENKGFVLPKRCRDCRAHRKEQTKHIVCCECGEVFEYTVEEQKFFEKNGYKEPRRCFNCRKSRKGKSDGQSIPEENK